MPRSINTQSAVAPKVGGGVGKRIVALAVMLVGIIGLIALAYFIVNRREAMVSVIRLKRAVTAGTTITQDLLEEYQMPKSTYDSLGSIVITDSNGNNKKQQIFLGWSQAPQVLGMFSSNYIGQGDILTAYDLTKDLTVRNPWVTAMKPDEEIFTMSFDASSVNSRMLYPGTRLRARLITSVPVSVSDEIRGLINKSENEADPPLVKNAVTTIHGDIIANAESSESIQMSEIVIDEIIITDMTNGSGESIYDLYMSLLKLPISNRVAYLKTTLGSNETANTWASRVTPSTITFVLDKESASRLAEFEKTGGSIKYTILPDDPESEDQANLMSQFIELSNQINVAASGT